MECLPAGSALGAAVGGMGVPARDVPGRRGAGQGRALPSTPRRNAVSVGAVYAKAWACLMCVLWI